MPEQKQEPDSALLPPLKRRGGRPKLVDGSARDVTIGVRVSLGEYQALADKAEQMGVKPAAWLRLAALSRRLPAVPATVDRRLEIAAIGRLGSNLNQLVRASHQGRATVDDELLLALLDEVRSLQAALIGRAR